jgi:hypothetical protein
MKGKIVAMIAAFILIMNVAGVLADGGYFPEPGYWIRPGQQRAVIFHEDNTETMILTSGFQGDAKNFVWIVPTPTIPEIEKASEKVFTNVAKLARPKYSYRIGYGGIMEAATMGVDAGRVIVLDSKQVDYYDVNVVFASNQDDLVEWFKENNYSYPEEYSYVLKHYIDKGWYFTAIKVSPETEGATEVMLDLREGNPTPIKLTFLSDKIVFPLKISSVDFPRPDDNETEVMPYYRYGNYVPIQLYVIAEDKYEADNFYTQYGNWVKKDQIEKLGEDENGEPLIQPEKSKYFLTSMQASYMKSQMDDDVFLRKADDNRKVNAGPETWQLFVYGLLIGLLIFTAWAFLPLGIMFIAGTLILFLSKNKGLRIFAWIISLVSLALTFVVGVAFLALVISSGAAFNYMVISALVTWGVIMVLMAVFIVLEIKYRRKLFP